MAFRKIILLYVLTTAVFFAVDLVWLGVVAKKLYRRLLGHILSDTVNWIPALLFYFLFVIGILIFSVLPAADKNSLTHAILFGGLFGFFAYATYDLTNLATLKDWPLKIVFIDILWGAVLTATVSIAGYLIAKAIS